MYKLKYELWINGEYYKKCVAKIPFECDKEDMMTEGVSFLQDCMELEYDTLENGRKVCVNMYGDIVEFMNIKVEEIYAT